MLFSTLLPQKLPPLGERERKVKREREREILLRHRILIGVWVPSDSLDFLGFIVLVYFGNYLQCGAAGLARLSRFKTMSKFLPLAGESL